MPATATSTTVAERVRGAELVAGSRPSLGTPTPVLPTNYRQLSAVIRAIGRNLRVEVAAPRGSLVHVYRDGALVATVSPEEAKAFNIPAVGAEPSDVQVVVVTNAGAVMSTPPSETVAPTETAAPTETVTPAKTGTSSKKVKASIPKPGKRTTDDTVKKSNNSGKSNK